ncbi:response regulator transcription factor, partial [Planctomycetota bacterium]
KVSCFQSPVECLNKLKEKRCDLLITDVKMPEMDGITLMLEAKHIAPWIPVLIVTGYGDIPTAVSAMKVGAVDFIEKPLKREAFLDKIKSIIHKNSLDNRILGRALSKSEFKTLKLVIQGKSSKDIANILHRSIRTIEVHRARVMQKLGVENLVDLVKRAVIMGLIELPENRNQTSPDKTKEKSENAK